MKKLLLGTNLKMYKTAQQTVQYLTDLAELIPPLQQHAEFFVIPSFTSLPASLAFSNTIRIGAQNMHWEDQGQFTGEVSPLMLKDLGGISLIEIGHSERRHVFNETSQQCNAKLTAAIKHGFTALLCIGETKEEKDYGIADEVLRSQLKIGLFGLPQHQLNQLWVAYEPVWSIGVGGTPATPAYAQEKNTVIRTVLKELYSDSGSEVPLLYGGSVNPENAVSLIKETDVDGLFIGRSAWDAKNFFHLASTVLDVWVTK